MPKLVKFSSTELHKELQRGQVSPVYLLLGEDSGGKDEFMQRLKSNLFKSDEESSLNTTVYYGGDAEPREIIENIRTYSIFSSKKLIIVKDFENSKDTKIFIDYLSSPNNDSVLLLLSGKIRVTKKVMDAVEKGGRVCIFWTMFQNESVRWVARRLKSMGVIANKEVIEYIVGLSGTGKDELNNQIWNISNYLEKGEELTLKKAKNIVTQLYNYTVFDLVNSLMVSNTREVLTIFRHLIGNGEDLVKLLYFCSREFKRLFTAYTLKMNGHDMSFISKTLNLRKREIARVRTVINHTTIEYFCTLFKGLHELDYTIKTASKEMGELAFERFIVRMKSS
jgi:DNA polymerase-3 subunit delta